MKLEIRCPDCDRVLLTADPAGLPELRQAARLRERAARSHEKEGRKAQLAIVRHHQDLADAQEARGLARFRAAWSRVVAEGEAYLCVSCDAWAELVADERAPHGVRSRRHRTKDKRARAASSDPPATRDA